MDTGIPRTVDLDGPVHYLEWEGPPERTFVLVHGLGGASVNWVGVGPGLAAHGRVLAPDLPGFGRSPLAGRSASIAANRRILSRFIREHGSGRVVLAGASMGSTIALLQAALEPGTVEALVLSASALPNRGGLPSPIVVGAFSLYLIPRVGEWVVLERMRRLSPERQVAIAFRVMAGDHRSIPEELRSLSVEMVRAMSENPESPAAYAEAARTLLRLLRRKTRMREAMARVECPVLLIHGRLDRLIPRASVLAAVADNSRWRLRLFPDLGHVPYLEAPDRWLAAVESFLEDFGLVSPEI